MMDEETIQSGAPKVCDECGVEPLSRIAVQRSSAGYYVGTHCDCGPYSRESGYFGTRATAEEALASGRFGREAVEETSGVIAMLSAVLDKSEEDLRRVLRAEGAASAAVAHMRAELAWQARVVGAARTVWRTELERLEALLQEAQEALAVDALALEWRALRIRRESRLERALAALLLGLTVEAWEASERAQGHTQA